MGPRESNFASEVVLSKWFFVFPENCFSTDVLLGGSVGRRGIPHFCVV